MKFIRRFVFLFTMLSFNAVDAQTLATMEVDKNVLTNELARHASTDLDAITFLPDSTLQFIEVLGNKKINIPYQIEHGEHRILHWMIESSEKSGKRIFQLVKSPAFNNPALVTAHRENGGLIIKSGSKNLVRYQFETMAPPAGVDASFKRSGFIHPLWSPRGQVLTRIQPPDHYHH
jgi:hypothetical protein